MSTLYRPVESKDLVYFSRPVVGCLNYEVRTHQPKQFSKRATHVNPAYKLTGGEHETKPQPVFKFIGSIDEDETSSITTVYAHGTTKGPQDPIKELVHNFLFGTQEVKAAYIHLVQTFYSLRSIIVSSMGKVKEKLALGINVDDAYERDAKTAISQMQIMFNSIYASYRLFHDRYYKIGLNSPEPMTLIAFMQDYTYMLSEKLSLARPIGETDMGPNFIRDLFKREMYTEGIIVADMLFDEGKEQQKMIQSTLMESLLELTNQKNIRAIYRSLESLRSPAETTYRHALRVFDHPQMLLALFQLFLQKESEYKSLSNVEKTFNLIFDLLSGIGGTENQYPNLFVQLVTILVYSDYSAVVNASHVELLMPGVMFSDVQYSALDRARAMVKTTGYDFLRQSEITSLKKFPLIAYSKDTDGKALDEIIENETEKTYLRLVGQICDEGIRGLRNQKHATFLYALFNPTESMAGTLLLQFLQEHPEYLRDVADYLVQNEANIGARYFSFGLAFTLNLESLKTFLTMLIQYIRRQQSQTVISHDSSYFYSQSFMESFVLGLQDIELIQIKEKTEIYEIFWLIMELRGTDKYQSLGTLISPGLFDVDVFLYNYTLGLVKRLWNNHTNQNEIISCYKGFLGILKHILPQDELSSVMEPRNGRHSWLMFMALIPNSMDVIEMYKILLNYTDDISEESMFVFYRSLITFGTVNQFFFTSDDFARFSNVSIETVNSLVEKGQDVFAVLFSESKKREISFQDLAEAVFNSQRTELRDTQYKILINHNSDFKAFRKNKEEKKDEELLQTFQMSKQYEDSDHFILWWSFAKTQFWVKGGKRMATPLSQSTTYMRKVLLGIERFDTLEPVKGLENTLITEFAQRISGFLYEFVVESRNLTFESSFLNEFRDVVQAVDLYINSFFDATNADRPIEPSVMRMIWIEAGIIMMRLSCLQPEFLVLCSFLPVGVKLLQSFGMFARDMKHKYGINPKSVLKKDLAYYIKKAFKMDAPMVYNVEDAPAIVERQLVMRKMNSLSYLLTSLSYITDEDGRPFVESLLGSDSMLIQFKNLFDQRQYTAVEQMNLPVSMGGFLETLIFMTTKARDFGFLKNIPHFIARMQLHSWERTDFTRFMKIWLFIMRYHAASDMKTVEYQKQRYKDALIPTLDSSRDNILSYGKSIAILDSLMKNQLKTMTSNDIIVEWRKFYMQWISNSNRMFGTLQLNSDWDIYCLMSNVTPLFKIDYEFLKWYEVEMLNLFVRSYFAFASPFMATYRDPISPENTFIHRLVYLTRNRSAAVVDYTLHEMIKPTSESFFLLMKMTVTLAKLISRESYLLQFGEKYVLLRKYLHHFYKSPIGSVEGSKDAKKLLHCIVCSVVKDKRFNPSIRTHELMLVEYLVYLLKLCQITNVSGLTSAYRVEELFSERMIEGTSWKSYMLVCKMLYSAFVTVNETDLHASSVYSDSITNVSDVDHCLNASFVSTLQHFEKTNAPAKEQIDFLNGVAQYVMGVFPHSFQINYMFVDRYFKYILDAHMSLISIKSDFEGNIVSSLFEKRDENFTGQDMKTLILRFVLMTVNAFQLGRFSDVSDERTTHLNHIIGMMSDCYVNNPTLIPAYDEDEEIMWTVFYGILQTTFTDKEIFTALDRAVRNTVFTSEITNVKFFWAMGVNVVFSEREISDEVLSTQYGKVFYILFSTVQDTFEAIQQRPTGGFNIFAKAGKAMSSAWSGLKNAAGMVHRSLEYVGTKIGKEIVKRQEDNINSMVKKSMAQYGGGANSFEGAAMSRFRAGDYQKQSDSAQEKIREDVQQQQPKVQTKSASSIFDDYDDSEMPFKTLVGADSDFYQRAMEIFTGKKYKSKTVDDSEGMWIGKPKSKSKIKVKPNKTKKKTKKTLDNYYVAKEGTVFSRPGAPRTLGTAGYDPEDLNYDEEYYL